MCAVLLLTAVSAAADEELDYGLDQTRLARIEIAGNVTFPDGDIKSILRLWGRNWRHPLSIPSYRPDLIDTQLRQLRGWYRARGFHDVTAALDSVGVDPELGDILYISIVEGPRTFIDKVEVHGAGPVTEDALRRVLALVEGEPAPADLNGFGEDMYRMRRLYWERAHLRAAIEAEMRIAETAVPDRRSAVVTYTVQPGPAYTVSGVTLVGDRVGQSAVLVWSRQDMEDRTENGSFDEPVLLAETRRTGSADPDQRVEAGLVEGRRPLGQRHHAEDGHRQRGIRVALAEPLTLVAPTLQP